MKKLVMGLLGAMMILSLAACTPTTEKNKTGEVKEPQQEEVVESTAARAIRAMSKERPDAAKPADQLIRMRRILPWSLYTVSAKMEARSREPWIP